MPDTLDKLDRGILYELSSNCRQPDSAIAKKLLKSKQVIRYRINNLEKSKIILDYNALIDFRVLGFSSFRMYFKLRNMSPKKEQEMYDYMEKNDLFLWTVNMEGDVDIAFYVWAKGLDQFYEKWEEFFHIYRQYILRQEFYLSINQIHYPMKILKKSHGVIDEWNVGKHKGLVKIDQTDFKILKILSRHAKMPSIDISEQIGISPKLAANRIKQLEKKGVILAYNAILDETKIGYNMFKVDFFLFNHSRLDEMYSFARSHPNIKNVMKTIGGPDFEIEVLVKDLFELRGLIDEIRSKFSEVIDYWRFNRVVRTIKQVYLPIEIE